MAIDTNNSELSLARIIAELFRANGYDGTSMARIGKETGMLKGSLYHHFPDGKKAMARAAVQAIADDFGQTQSSLLRSNDQPLNRLTNWCEYLGEFYSHGERNCILGSLTLSGGLVNVSEEIKQAFTLWIDELAHVLVDEGFSETDARQRAQSALEQIQGALIVARALNDFSSFQQLMHDLPDILLSQQ